MIEQLSLFLKDWAANPYAASVSAIFTFVMGAMFKSWLDRRSAKSLEVLRSELREQESENAKYHQRNEDRLATLQRQALLFRSTKANALAERRISALLVLWEYAVDASPLHNAALFAQSINFERAIEAASKNDVEAKNVRQLGDTVWKIVGLDKVTYDAKADKVRPLVPPIVWAIFSAYRSVAAYPVAQIAMVKAGLESKLIKDSSAIVKLAKSALPQYVEELDKYGVSFLPHIVDDLREKLFSEIALSLEDDSQEKREMDHAKEILDAVGQIEPLHEPQGK